MNENDKKVRKQWFIVFIVSVLINCITTTLQILFDPNTANIPLVKPIFMTVSLSILVTFNFIFYRCAYKKPGTKLLVFFLIMTIITLVITPIFYLTGKIQPPPHIPYPYYEIYVIMTQAMGGIWIVLCWRMRKTNLRLQELQKL
jgi:hypothetical protein